MHGLVAEADPQGCLGSQSYLIVRSDCDSHISSGYAHEKRIQLIHKDGRDLSVLSSSTLSQGEAGPDRLDDDPGSSQIDRLTLDN